MYKQIRGKLSFGWDCIILYIIIFKESANESVGSVFHSDNDYNYSIVNNIPAFNGGSHVDAFKRTFYKNLINALTRESKKRKLKLSNSDIQSGLLIYNITKMQAPDFDSQSKTRLINEEPAKIIKKALEDPEIYKQIIKRHTV